MSKIRNQGQNETERKLPAANRTRPFVTIAISKHLRLVQRRAGSPIVSFNAQDSGWLKFGELYPENQSFSSKICHTVWQYVLNVKLHWTPFADVITEKNKGSVGFPIIGFYNVRQSLTLMSPLPWNARYTKSVSFRSRTRRAWVSCRDMSELSAIAQAPLELQLAWIRMSFFASIRIQ